MELKQTFHGKEICILISFSLALRFITTFVTFKHMFFNKLFYRMVLLVVTMESVPYHLPRSKKCKSCVALGKRTICTPFDLSCALAL